MNMPRITPFRALKSLIRLWLAMIVMWICLPSFPIPPEQHNIYITEVLSAGQSIVTSLSKYVPYEEDDDDGHLNYKAHGLSIDWQFHARPNDQSLHAISLQVGNNEVNVSAINSDANAFFDQWERSAQNATSSLNATTPTSPPPYLSPAFQTEIIYNDAHPLSMPWWSLTDQIVLGRAIRGANDAEFSRNRPLSLCIVVPRRSMLEVWPVNDIDDAVIGELRKHSTIFRHGSRNSDDVAPLNPDLPVLAESAETGMTDDDIVQEAYKRRCKYGHALAEFDLGAVFEPHSRVRAVTELAARRGVIPIPSRIFIGNLPSKMYPLRRVLAVPLGWSYAVLAWIIDHFVAVVPQSVAFFFSSHIRVIVPACLLILLVGAFARRSRGSSHAVARFGWWCCEACLGRRGVERLVAQRWMDREEATVVKLEGFEREDRFDATLRNLKSKTERVGDAATRLTPEVQKVDFAELEEGTWRSGGQF